MGYVKYALNALKNLNLELYTLDENPDNVCLVM